MCYLQVKYLFQVFTMIYSRKINVWVFNTAYLLSLVQSKYFREKKCINTLIIYFINNRYFKSSITYDTTPLSLHNISSIITIIIILKILKIKYNNFSNKKYDNAMRKI